jgi:tRNA/tmRNA/rRNA uracil-C5-methylase (TrmA/RlmC/RlmD family)
MSKGVVIDLFSGTGSATKPFAEAGYKVIRVELDPQ